MAIGSAAAAQAVAASPQQPTALLVLVSAGEKQLQQAGLSVGILSASQGHYSPEQLMLDIGAGARVGSSVYDAAAPPPLALRPAPGGGGRIEGWTAATRRARRVPQLLELGLLADLAGGAGYVAAGASGLGAIAAAGRDGRVHAVSLGPAETVVPRTRAMLGRERLVVADLPEGQAGMSDLARLIREQGNAELILAVQRVPDGANGQLLWLGSLGLRSRSEAELLNGTNVLGVSKLFRPAELTSASTNERGLVVSVDLAPTVLAQLGRTSLPEQIRGKAIEEDGSLDGAALRSLDARLRVVGPRRLRALAFLLLGWALLLLAGARSVRTRTRARAMRAGALAVMWAPVVVLVPAALAPSAPVEYLIITLGCLGLGGLTDRLIPWPRAPLAPALVALLALTFDALAHTQLLVRSLLGPNPILGARFYGIGNELKSALAVLVLAAAAGALYPATRGRRPATVFACAGAVLAVIVGAARIGAGVGGVILVCVGFAVATIMMLGGALSRRRALIVLLSPIAGLVVLAAIDLLTAHGSGHYTGSVLHARSAGELRDLIVRRYKAAWGELHNHAMPVAAALCLACGAFGIRRRDRLLAPVGVNPAWLAAFAGGLTAAVVGALAEDSGPVLLVVGVFVLGCLASYLWGHDPHEATAATSSPRKRREALSHAPRPSAERVG